MRHDPLQKIVDCGEKILYEGLPQKRPFRGGNTRGGAKGDAIRLIFLMHSPADGVVQTHRGHGRVIERI